jgi:hypothetical protein
VSEDPGARDLDVALRLHVYDRFVLEGRPPTLSAAALALDAPVEDVEAALLRLVEGRAIVLRPGTMDVWMASPFSAFPTPFTVEVEDRSVFANCAWDALGVIAMLGGTGMVSTSCPDCEWPMKLVVRQGVLEPAEGVIHFAVPAAHWWDDIGFT